MAGRMISQPQIDGLEIDVELSRIRLLHQQLSKVIGTACDLLRHVGKLLVVFEDAAESRLQHVPAARAGGHSAPPAIALRAQGFYMGASHSARLRRSTIRHGRNSATLR